jgi:hypothetical protein
MANHQKTPQKKKEPVDKSKVIITLNLDQAYMLMNAMEFYARVHIGQFDAISREFTAHADCNGKSRDWLWKNDCTRKELEFYLNKSRELIFPELKSVGVYGSHGIYSTEISPYAHDAWDLYQVIRRELALHREPNPTSFSNSYNHPMKSSETNPLPEVRIRIPPGRTENESDNQ